MHNGHGGGHRHHGHHGMLFAELAFLAMIPGFRLLLLGFVLVVLCGGT
jgi:hypothetical protein